MEQWYKCPECQLEIPYATDPCPKCKSNLSWQSSQPVKYTSIDLPALIEMVRSGKVQTTIEGIENPIILHKTETLRFSLPAFNYLEARSVRESTAFYGGPSFHIAKGVNLRLGVAKGHGESHDELRVIDSGNFVLTTERVVFMGATRTVTIALSDILSLGAFEYSNMEGVAIRKDGTSKTQYFVCPKQVLNALTLNMTIQGNHLQDKLSEHWIQAFIEGAMKAG